MVYIREFNPMTTCLTAFGVTAILGAVGFMIILATKESCPFVYSFDGEQYILDGEPYGGSICEAFKRTDLCRLDYLRPIDDQYLLQLANEVNETQYTDEFKLWIVDHPPEVDVIQDAQGKLYTVKDLHKPVAAVDRRNEDLLNWLSKKDMLFWESNIINRNAGNNSELRDTLVLTFLRPPDAWEAKLVVHGCNTLWASQMLMRMVGLCGSFVDQFYEKMKDPESLTQREKWADWTDIYALNVDIWSNGQWVQRGKIIGCGPFVAEERIVPLSLDGVEGDVVKIRLAPPIGFWQFNSFAMDYSVDVPFQMQEISASSMIAHDGMDLCATLESSDGRYYVTPEIGQHAFLSFPVPEQAADKDRTIFAKVSGYYEMHLNASGLPQLAKIERILTEPDYVIKFSLEEFEKWRKAYALSLSK
jgi:hypothetical protein